MPDKYHIETKIVLPRLPRIVLKETGLGEGRVVVIQMDDGGIERKMQELQDFCLKISALAQGSRAKVFQT